MDAQSIPTDSITSLRQIQPSSAKTTPLEAGFSTGICRTATRDYTIDRPDWIQPRHWQEWQQSGVHSGIIEANVRSLSGTSVFEYLFYSPKLQRTNTGRVQSHYLRQYASLEAGGWWCQGGDPLNNWKPMLWGQFKPDSPRLSTTVTADGRSKQKLVKYEPPPQVPTRAYFLSVPDSVAQRIFDRYNVLPTPRDRVQGFWHCVWAYHLPIVITEGAKKAGALLTAGFAAIALPGISNGYRTPKDENGQRSGKRFLIPDLQFFTQPERTVYFCFDHDDRLQTQAAVRTNLQITGQLFASYGCPVRVIDLPGPEKGVDDYLVARSPAALETLYEQALTLPAWVAAGQYQLTAPVAQTVHQPFLTGIQLPQSGLVGIRSPKGTGKTALLEPLIQSATRIGRPVLLISHRVQLGQATCDRLGIDYISEVRDSATAGRLGIGLCIDSLHANSQARFQAADWKGAIVILDECEQILWHALNSQTCQAERVAILKTFKQLLQWVLSTGGLVIAQDADLSDYSLDCLQQYSEITCPPWLLVNTWKSPTPQEILFYDTPDPSLLYSHLQAAIATGAVYICTDSQKPGSKWGTINLEARLQQDHPDRRILRIDSETVADPQHPAYGCVARLNETIAHYDIVIASPSIGTGVSIDLRGHFQGVFGLFQGTISENEARQALARVREAVPRFVWARPFGVGKVGGGSTDYRQLAQTKIRQHQANMRLLKDVDFNLEEAFDPITFRTWAKYAARVNAGLVHFRDALWGGLVREGQQVDRITLTRSEQAELSWIQTLQSQVAKQNHWQAAIAVATADPISSETYAQLQRQRGKTSLERHQQEHHRIALRYGIPVSPELCWLDWNHAYSKLRLHYYLIHGADFARDRDRRHLLQQFQQGDGTLCLQDLRTYAEKVEALKLLGITQFLDSDREFRGTDPAIEKLAQQSLQWRKELKALFNVTFSPEMSTMQIIQVLLGILGLKLHRDRRAKLADGSRCWVYRFLPDQCDALIEKLQRDHPEASVEQCKILRSQIFQAWLLQDQSRVAFTPDRGGETPENPQGHPLDIEIRSDPPPDHSLSESVPTPVPAPAAPTPKPDKCERKVEHDRSDRPTTAKTSDNVAETWLRVQSALSAHSTRQLDLLNISPTPHTPP